MSIFVTEFQETSLITVLVVAGTVLALRYVYNTITSDETSKSPAVKKRKIQIQLRVEKETNVNWDEELDVVVVGSGAAGASTAVKAALSNKDATIAVLEKDADEWGGTSKKSGGIFWIPRNSLMDIDDPREDCIMHMAEQGYPDAYQADSPRFGLSKIEYERLEAYYDNGYKMVDEMKEIGLTPNLSKFTKIDGTVMSDYSYQEQKELNNKAPSGRGLGVGDSELVRSIFVCVAKIVEVLEPFIRFCAKYAPGMKDILLVNNFGIDLSYGVGPVFVGTYQSWLKKNCNNVQIRMGHAVEGIVTDQGGTKVVGVLVRRADTNEMLAIKTSKGVVFATGGFSMNQDMLRENLPGEVFQTGACKNATGDFHKLAMLLEADMVGMNKIWGCETHLEETLKSWETETCIFHMRGDSFFVVNAEGKRVYNEKGTYDKRARVHWANDANKFLFLIGDFRCADTWGAAFGKTWLPDLNDPMYIKGKTSDELARNIKQRLQELRSTQLSKSVGNASLDPHFSSNVEMTLERFNEFARNGVDTDFDRGLAPSEREWTYSPQNPYPNNTMHPLDISTDGFYCLILSSSVIDTKGGVAVDAYQRVLRNGGPIKGLYAAGNACAPASGDAYWSGGTTLGSAMVGGWIAGENVMKA